MQAAEGLWKKQGIRPANQPHVRLAQYRGLWEKSPDWPAQLQHWATHTPTVGDAAESTRAFRSRQRKAQTHILPPTQMLIDAGIGLRKAQTILLDAWLPLAAALTGQTDAWFASWYHAVPGDLPDAIQALAKLLHLAQSGRPSQPMSHGLGQGLLPVLLDVRKKRGDR